jgi:pimeloyl-ACP methyl ester carboxylesterase
VTWSGTVELDDGGHLAVDDDGAGPAVVLIHPGLWDRRTWDPQMRTFPAAGLRTIRYDVRGYGASSRLSGSPYSHVRDLVAVLDRLEVDAAALVGCSMGGRIAIDATLEVPDRVRALVPIAAGLGGLESMAEEDDWWEDAMAPAEEAYDAGDMERAQEERLRIWAPLGTDDEAGAAIRRIAFDNLHELTMDESVEIALDPPAAHRLHEIRVPTLVVKAEHDPPYSRRTSDVIAAQIPGAREVMIDADHVVNLRAPEAFDGAVIPFLREASP